MTTESTYMKFNLELQQQIIDDAVVNDTYFVLHERRGLILREFMDLKEEATKQALIKLGWTPPPDKF